MRIELKALSTLDYVKPEVPDDAGCCAVLMYARIGREGSDGADLFHFTVITPAFLVRHPETQWAHGFLLVEEFSWSEVERMVTRLVSSISSDSWEKAAAQLGRYMKWEFDNYQP